ncbi:hypothetical protein [Micromonospora sp. WMMD736]|uniref:hypothetical protein n=1 Tax=Micromonospora sp. WMMD736 TaxID=3404112 RepID=UPI003B942FB1
MSGKPKTRTYVVTFVKKVYADVVVELPEEGFSAGFAVETAFHDISPLDVRAAVVDDAVTREGDWQFDSVDLAVGDDLFSVIL